ncbi:MAG: nucleoid-associated protein, partial [Culicoidibacterales bacterium]
FVSKQIEAVQADLQHKAAKFMPTSPILPLLAHYRESRDFIGLANQLAAIFSLELGRCEALGNHDLLVVEYQHNQRSQVACVLLARKSAYTHHVTHSETGVENEIIRHQAILPNSSQKPTTYVLIDVEQETVLYRDRKRIYDGDKRFVLPEVILQVDQAEQSPSETLKIINKITAELVEDHDLQPSIALAKVKQCLVATAQAQTPFIPMTLANEVFANEPNLQQAFQAKLAEQAVPQRVEIAPKVAQRTGKMHTLKTDSGIEIRIPSEFVSNANYIEFNTQPDGTIAIQLRNIVKITDK